MGRYFVRACLRVLVDPQVILGCSGPISSDMQRLTHTNARAPRPTHPSATDGSSGAPSASHHPARLCTDARRAIAIACTTATRNVRHTTLRSLRRTHRMRPIPPPDSTHVAHTPTGVTQKLMAPKFCFGHGTDHGTRNFSTEACHCTRPHTEGRAIPCLSEGAKATHP